MRRRVALFALGFALAAGLPVTVWLLSRAQKAAGWAFPFPQQPKRPAPAPRIPPNNLPDPEPPFVALAPFKESADGPTLIASKLPEVKPLPPVAVPTLAPSQRLGDRKHRGPVAFGPFALSADGTTAVFTGGTTGYSVRNELGLWQGPELIVWNVAAGREIGRASGSCAQVALSPNGQTLFTGGSREHFRGDGKLLVWDVRTGKVVRERPTALWALSADGKTLATVDIHIGTFDRMHADEPEVPWRSTLALWNAADFTLRSAFTYTAFVPTSLALSHDGSKAVCAYLGTVTAFETAGGKPLWKRQLARANNDPWNNALLVVSPDGKSVAAGHQNMYPDPQMVRLLDMADGKDRVLVEFVGRALSSLPQLVGLAFAPDGKVLLAAFDGGTVSIELASGKPEQLGSGPENEVFRPGLHPPGFGAHGFALSGDGKTAVFAGRSEVDACGLRVVDAASRAVKFPPKLEPVVPPFPPADTYLVPYRVWRPETIAGPKLANGRSLYWLGPAGPLSLDNTGPQTMIGTGDTFGYVVTPDGETLITRGMLNRLTEYPNRDDPQMRFRDPNGKEWGEAVGPAREQIGSRRALAMSADGRTLAALHPDGGIWLWEVATAKPRLRLERAGVEDVYRFSFSRDGRYLMSIDYHAQSGLVWDLSGASEKEGAPDAVELAALWEALRGADASAAYRAVWRLAAHPAEGVPLLRGKAKDMPAVTDAARLAARPFDPDIVLARRVVEALERCGTPEAVALIKEFAAQPAFAAPADAALRRLGAK